VIDDTTSSARRLALQGSYARCQRTKILFSDHALQIRLFAFIPTL
jgi:hypothetical protein